MIANRKILSPLTILMIVIVLAALATWVIPAGQYDRLSYTEGAVLLIAVPAAMCSTAHTKNA